MLRRIPASFTHSINQLIRPGHHVPFVSHRSPLSSIKQSVHPVLSISRLIHNSARQVLNEISQSNNQLVEASDGPAINQPELSVKDRNYFPYGLSDFEEIRENNQFFVDRTSFISQFEFTCDHCLFLRPPQFGKTLFLNQLRLYYDLRTSEDQFKRLFGDLEIVKDQSNWISRSSHVACASQPTPGCRTFHVLELNLAIDTSGSIDAIRQRLHDHINERIDAFCVKYKLTGNVANRKFYVHNSFARLEGLAMALVAQHRSGQLKQRPRLLVLVDEYDRYALDNTEQYSASMGDKKPVGSFLNLLSSLLETLKSIDSINGFSDYKTLVVGITPVAFADASGANVWKNISSDPAFSNLCGFTEMDLKRGLSDIGFTGDKQLIPLKIMKSCYNGYKFPGCESSLYNPQQALDFLGKLQSGYLTIDRLAEVAKMFDDNLKVNLSDEGLVDPNSKPPKNVLAVVARLSALQIFSSLNDGSSYTLCDPIQVTSLIDPEPITLAPITNHSRLSHLDHIVSFLYYYGWLTIKEQVYGNRHVFKIPNELTRPLFLDHLKTMVLQREDLSRFVADPTEEGLARILDRLHAYLDDGYWTNHLSEDALATCFKMLFAAVYGSSIQAEPLTKRPGYIDIWLQSRVSKQTVMIEFKRIRPNALRAGKQEDKFDWGAMGRTSNSDLFDYLTNLRPAELRSLKCWSPFKQGKPSARPKTLSIRQVENNAIKQVNEYEPPYSMGFELPSTFTRFTAVQVGKPFLIRKIEEQ
ncbi:hypothetical protein HDU85_001242 [Gaertneriomyces sp. JEL0708]|nr:hypothetical protein HDU85_001242 [Gaertneriomyces sp. JEL0708]